MACTILAGMLIFLVGCMRDESSALISGKFPGSYRIVFTNEQQAVQLQERLSVALHAKHGPDEWEAKHGQQKCESRFWRWRQDDDHLRIDLYIDDLSKQRYEKGTGFRLCLDVVDDIAQRIRLGFMNPQPGERRSDVYHDSRVMGEWTGWHWGMTKKDVIRQIKDPQEFEWGLVEDQLAWARLHGMTRREALARWNVWRNAHPEWNPYAFATNRLTILDGDPGTGDFAAMLILAKHGKRAEHFPGVCVATYGNTRSATALRNMMLGAWYLEASPVLVLGEAKPYGVMPYGFFRDGESMDDIREKLYRRFQLTEERFRRFTHSQDELLRLIMESDDVVYIATGPLTTLARLLERAPQCEKHIKRLFVVGGVLVETRNPDPDLALLRKAERNFRVDGVAAQRIFASSIDITLFPLNFTYRKAQLTSKEIDALADIGRSSVAVSCFRQNIAVNVKESLSKDAAILHDAMPALYALHPDKFQVIDRRLVVDQQGHLSEVSSGRIVHVVSDMEPELLYTAISNSVYRCFEPRETR